MKIVEKVFWKNDRERRCKILYGQISDFLESKRFQD